MKRTSPSERGMALVFTLLGVSLLSILAASLVYVTSAGTFGSLAFKSHMQASFAANTGAQKALDWFRTYYAPNWLDSTSGISTTGSSYVYTVQPPTYNGSGVVMGGSSPNFPGATVRNSFAALSTSPSNQVAMDNVTASYTLVATLLAHDRYTDIDGVATIGERWNVAITGTVPGPLGNSVVKETAIIERMFIPTFKDALRGQCDVYLGGSIYTDSYSSSSGSYGGSNLFTGAAAQASVGSNSFIQDTGGGGTINGNAYYGNTAGTCTGAANFSHPNVVQGQILQAPGVPFPAISPAFTDVTDSNTNDCSGNSDRILQPNTQNSGNPPPSGTAHYRTCNPGGSATITLCVPGPSAGTQYFFFNSVTLSGSQDIQVAHQNASNNCTSTLACSASNPCAPVKVYINQDMSMGGGGVTGMVPNNPGGFGILYSGTADASFTGNSDFYGTLYAPSASLTLRGGAVVYGAVSAQNVSDSGNATIHYDLTLQSSVGYVTLFRVINQTRNVF